MYLAHPVKGVLRPNGAVRETRLELVHIRLEAYEDRLREVYRPKGLLTYAAAAREYVRLL
jgi:hypothetical protein